MAFFVCRTIFSKYKKQVLETVNQVDVLRAIAEKLPVFRHSEIKVILEAEREFVMDSIKNGKRVVMKNYLTMYPIKTSQRTMKNPLTNKIVDVPAGVRIGVRTGEGFKRFINNK